MICVGCTPSSGWTIALQLVNKFGHPCFILLMKFESTTNDIHNSRDKDIIYKTYILLFKCLSTERQTCWCVSQKNEKSGKGWRCMTSSFSFLSSGKPHLRKLPSNKYTFHTSKFSLTQTHPFTYVYSPQSKFDNTLWLIWHKSWSPEVQWRNMDNKKTVHFPQVSLLNAIQVVSEKSTTILCCKSTDNH